MKNKYKFAFLVSLIFFLVSLFTIRDYGVDWDEALHFRRGQAYLHYYLTGNTTYQDLAEENYPRRSFYQVDKHNMEGIMKIDGAHGPLSDQLAALSNYIFYQKLNLADDISSHHLYIIFASSILVFIVAIFAAETMGYFGALVASLSLITYPLFFSESHFNIKDPVQAAYFAGVIWAFWKSLQKGNVKWLWLSFIFLTLAIGTKLNIVFVPFIILPYLLFRYKKYLKNIRSSIKKIPKKYKWTLLVGPIFVLLVFVGTWPFLWKDTIVGIERILGYYTDIGTGFNYQPSSYYLFGFNLYPIIWILFTSPPITLTLTALSFVIILKNYKTIPGFVFLWLIWLLIPILRVTVPGTSIYGGIRQIFEFIPAASLLAGFAAWWTVNRFKKERQKYVKILVLALFLWPIFILVKTHPYENVYFNFLTGGLSGARERNIPAWGNSYGTVYRTGIEWLNEHAEPNSKLSLIQGTPPNAPEIWLRDDIDLNNDYWSGIDRNGEYLMELTFNDSGRSYFYAWEYVEKFLSPVYELRVDEVPILKIWKNDLEHTKKQYKLKEREYTNFTIEAKQDELLIDLNEEVTLSRLELKCSKLSDVLGNFVETSLDGVEWEREKDWIPFPQVGNKDNFVDGQINYYFAGKSAKYVRLIFSDIYSCDKDSLKVWILGE